MGEPIGAILIQHTNKPSASSGYYIGPVEHIYTFSYLKRGTNFLNIRDKIEKMLNEAEKNFRSVYGQ